MKKPPKICHMMLTIDGRIISGNWRNQQLIETYPGFFEKYHDTFESQVWMCGRITMERNFSGGVQPELIKPKKTIVKEAFVGDKNASSFAIAIDTHGKLGWGSN